MELEQIETDFPDYVLLEKGKLRSVYRINYLPTDPDWVSEVDAYYSMVEGLIVKPR